MTTAQATAATAFITHPALRTMATDALVNGRTFICQDCGNISDANTGCYPCDDALFATLCAEHDTLTANAETYDPFDGVFEMDLAGRVPTGGSRYGDL